MAKIKNNQIKVTTDFDFNNNIIKNGGVESLPRMSPPANPVVGQIFREQYNLGLLSVYTEANSWYNSLDYFVYPKLDTIRGSITQPSILETAILNTAYTNQLWDMPISNVIFETSTDDTTWTSLVVPDNDLENLFNEGTDEGAAINIPKGSFLRIQLNVHRSCLLETLCLYGVLSGFSIKIETKYQGSSVFVEKIPYQSIDIAGFGNINIFASLKTFALEFDNNARYFESVRVTMWAVIDPCVLRKMLWYSGSSQSPVSQNEGSHRFKYPFTWSRDKVISCPKSLISNETINYDASIEPTQSGTVVKTSTWIWQYLAQSIKWIKGNFLRLSGGTMTGVLTAPGFKLPNGAADSVLLANGSSTKITGIILNTTVGSLTATTNIAAGTYLIVSNPITSTGTITLNFPTDTTDLNTESVVTFKTNVAAGIKINTISSGKIYAPTGVLSTGATYTSKANKSYVISALCGDVIIGEF